MIQLYYLADASREHRFDAVFAQLDVIASFFPIVKVPALTAFVTREKAINQQNFILCDLAEAAWSVEHILSAVQLLRRFTVARLIFLSPPGDHTTALYKLLAEQRIDGLIVDGEGEPAADVLVSLLQGGSGGYARRFTAMGKAVASAAAQKMELLHIPPGMVLDVSVCGAMPRIGTTTQAFALYHFLSQVGFHPAILDQGQQSLKSVLELYKDRTEEWPDHLVVNGICVASNKSPTFDAYISDYGVLTQGWVSAFCGADISVLVGGVKPWELPMLAEAHTTATQESPHELITLLSFAAPEDLAAVKEYLGSCAAVSYHPDIWRAGSDAVYRQAVLPCLKKLCGQT